MDVGGAVSIAPCFASGICSLRTTTNINREQLRRVGCAHRNGKVGTTAPLFPQVEMAGVPRLAPLLICLRPLAKGAYSKVDGVTDVACQQDSATEPIDTPLSVNPVA